MLEFGERMKKGFDMQFISFSFMADTQDVIRRCCTRGPLCQAEVYRPHRDQDPLKTRAEAVCRALMMARVYYCYFYHFLSRLKLGKCTTPNFCPRKSNSRSPRKGLKRETLSSRDAGTERNMVRKSAAPKTSQ